MPTPSFTPGQRVTLQRVVHRAPRLQPSIEEVVVDVNLWQPEHDLMTGHELSRFSYLSGYREHGRDIGARNPYDDDSEWRSNCFASGGLNGYFVAPEDRNLCGEWTVVPQPPQADPGRPAGIRSYATPTGVPIAGTLENLTGTAILNLEDGRVELSIDPKTGRLELQSDYEGTTDIHWDGQATAIEEGQMVFVDESGRHWRADQLIPLDPNPQ